MSAKERGGMKLKPMTAISGAAKPAASKQQHAERLPCGPVPEPSIGQSRTTMLSLASQPISTSSSSLPGERLLAQLLDDEDMIADPNLVLDARPQRIFVVEPPAETVVAPLPCRSESA